MNVARLNRFNLIQFFNVQRCCTVVPRLINIKVPEIRRKLDGNSCTLLLSNRNFVVATNLIDLLAFENVCSTTLESLCDYFEEIVETDPKLNNPDITFSDGVLTVKLGKEHGTYVINRQTPNRQIWLSSPISGPKRYDFVPIKNKINEGYWIYKHDGVTLHELLQKELKEIFSIDINFLDLPHSNQN